jgi:hypothetical protein
MAKKVNRKWIENKKWIVEWNGHQVNMMRISKDICLKVKWNDIVDEVQSINRLSHSPARKKSYFMTPSRKAEMLWNDTEYHGRKGTLSGSRGTIRLGGKNCGGRGGPSYGVTVGMGDDLVGILETLIHEITHVIHLEVFYEPTINGKRRPHDWVFNAIMLRAMKDYFGLNKSQLKPRCMGWSVGNGYAPSRQIERIFRKKWVSLEDIPKRLTKHFNKDIPQTKNKKVLTDEEKEKKLMGGFRRTLTSCLKGMREYDGYLEVMDDSWNIADGEEYILNLFDRIRPTMSIKEAGLDDNEIVVLEWFIIEQQEVWAEYNWQYNLNWTQQENRMNRVRDLWNFLNR